MLCEGVALIREISGWVGQTEPLMCISELNFFPKGSTVISDRKAQEKSSLAKLHLPTKKKKCTTVTYFSSTNSAI